jgi:VanZ family protein
MGKAMEESLKSQRFSRLLSRFLPLIIWMAFIAYASSDEFSAANTSRIIGPLVLWLFPNFTSENLALVQLVTRKAAHFGEYAVLGFLAARAFRSSPRPRLKRNWFVIALALIAVYALLDEYHQSFVPSRTASILDSLIDTIGGLTALVVVRRWKTRV